MRMRICMTANIFNRLQYINEAAVASHSSTAIAIRSNAEKAKVLYGYMGKAQ